MCFLFIKRTPINNRTIGIPIYGISTRIETGNKIQAKLASNDNTLIRKIGEILIFIDQDFETKITFVEKLENFDAMFFLSTDSVHDKKRIIDRFGNKIITSEPILERTSPQGIVDAVIDLFCLSKTKGIIGSYKSTFSQVAAEIGRIENKEVFID